MKCKKLYNKWITETYIFKKKKNDHSYTKKIKETVTIKGYAYD